MGYADRETFVDVEFITLKQRSVDLIIPEAIEYCSEQNFDGNQDVKIREYLQTHKEPVQLAEFVSCHYSGFLETLYVTVGLNVNIINEEAEQYGLELLGQMEVFEPGAYQEFGEHSTFYPWRHVGEQRQ